LASGYERAKRGTWCRARIGNIARSTANLDLLRRQ
jgi:hypothetical protein